MDYFKFTTGVAREEAAQAHTHRVDFTGLRSRVYTAICGAKVHIGEMSTRASGEPTCPICQTLLADAEDETIG